ncbi:octanoyl-[acyl-carrier-protein]:protein N-octanoyltransferase LIPT2, mitochondrial-like [Ornithodoros turicata]|uniref:octanoyl-[acyl-carrier-protein]:protein N-octanoyltransferase LIPT2, mitochondrial-like n=1 Tax=Ornithodoros turicata TaxID=34597 RepID=UPI003139DC8D
MCSKVLVQAKRLGRMGFSKAYNIQQAAASRLYEEISANPVVIDGNTLITVEHDPVYTVGIRSKEYTAEQESVLRQLGAEFVRTNRGGLITFHGPGQLVAYPILYLGSFNKSKSMRWYVCTLEKTIIDFCSHFGLDARTTEHTGVWIGDNKVAAIGIHGSRFVTTHGIAINCNTDLAWFDHIIPCGIKGKGVTSLSRELGRDVSIDDAHEVFLDAFRKHFNCETSLVCS